ncbi:MAG: MaoC family dehydratase [Bryobacterales bacterium]|nr:MaoC family dehydratase [Bryobacterales bacterium]
MPKREIETIEELRTLAGAEVAVSEWLEITQQRIDAFAAATDDFQWIHVDAERAQRESPFGTTIAHGYLTLSLISQFSYSTVGLKQPFAMTINYGCNKVRFISPVKCGARIRSRHQLLEVSDVEGGWQTRWNVTIEIEGQQKPACVAETIGRFYRAKP